MAGTREFSYLPSPALGWNAGTFISALAGPRLERGMAGRPTVRLRLQPCWLLTSWLFVLFVFAVCLFVTLGSKASRQVGGKLSGVALGSNRGQYGK